MSENIITLIVLLSPAVFIITAIASWYQSGFRPKLIKLMSMTSSIISMMIAALSCYFVYQFDLLESGLIGINDFGLSIRLDALSVIMLSMITLLGFIIIKFSNNYLDGDQRQGAFIGRLAATIASVQLLVLSGNLGLLLATWILTSISLHRLLVFYRDRPGAQIAARKKFILARLGDACLLVSIILLYNQFGSGNLEVIFNSIKENATSLEGPALFLVLAAIFKSAQFPTHGWLIEVMETPTPVSALLHAGLLNAGPFLIVRMSMVMDASTIAPILLMSIGGFTALFGSVVYLTQTSVKTALGYSSVAHMGFSLMACGMGVYSAAMLHLVAHSFYKAHSFLSSGSVIDVLRGSKVASVAKSVSAFQIVLGIAMAMALYTAFALIWGIDPENQLGLLFIGAVIVMGVSRIFVFALGSKLNIALLAQAAFIALTVTTAFFALESSMHFLLSSQLPDMSALGFGKSVAAAILILVFAAVVLIQIIAPQFSKNSFNNALSVHVKNGFYVNAIFDRLVGALRIHSTESKQVIKHQNAENIQSDSSALKHFKEQLV